MARRRSTSSTASSGDVVDGEILSSTPLATLPTTQLNLRSAGGARSAIGDGGFFDATQGRNPVYAIAPRSDSWSVFIIWRAYLSAARHNFLPTVIGTAGIIYGTSLGLSFGLNALRGDVRSCNGDNWNPVILGCNLSSFVLPISQTAAGGAHDFMLGEDRLTQPPIKSEVKIRAVRVDGVGGRQ